MDYVINAINGVFLYIYYLYGWHKLDDKKIDIKNPKNYISLLVFVVFGTLVNVFVPHSVKMIIITILLLFLSYWAVFKNLRKALAATIVVQGVTMLCEMLLILVVSFFGGIDKFMDTFIGPIAFNLFISILCIVVIGMNITDNIYSWLIKVTSKIRKNILIKYSSLMLLFAVFFTSVIYMKQPFQLVLGANTLAIVFFCWLALRVTTSESKNEETAQKYKMSKEILENVENEMTEYMIDNHETKKELRIIKEMLVNNDPGLIDYIDELEKKNDDVNIKDSETTQINKIPWSFFKQILKDKMTEMISLDIQYQILISNKIKKSTFLNFSKKEELATCNIIGVFMDNAIYAVKNLSEKSVVFEMYCDEENLCIMVSNNFEGIIDVNKIYTPKYTTKGKGHGYGLSLVKKIISNNKKITNETEICNNTFIQTLKIKM